MSTPSPPTIEKPPQQTPEVTPEAEAIVEWMQKFGVTLQKAADLLKTLKDRQPSPESVESKKALEAGIAWMKLIGERNAVKKQVGELEAWKAPEASGFRGELTALEE